MLSILCVFFGSVPWANLSHEGFMCTVWFTPAAIEASMSCLMPSPITITFSGFAPRPRIASAHCDAVLVGKCSGSTM